MKMNFQREAGSEKREAKNLQPSTFNLQPSRRGMALVITLIMLSVTLIMAIAFLAISKRERVSVSTSTDSTTARFASDSGSAAAQAQILANIRSTNTALYSYNLLVSTNYINPLGYVQGSASPTNVNFDYTVNNAVFTLDDRNQDIANLMFLPRAPVMVTATETNGRFYLDLNRNGVFDPTGDLPFSVNALGLLGPAYPGAVGDPQWIGMLEHPGLPHGPDNKFLSRFAFIVLPVGESLDLNAIHNSARLSGGGADKGFLRNEGVGSWEINLAAFLADLNTNQWFQQPVSPYTSYYDYEPTYVSGPFSQYRAFDDAFSLLTNRYNGSYNYLATAANSFWFPNIANYPINIDLYSDGPLQLATTNFNYTIPLNQDNIGRSWAGAYNTNRFFTPDDFFNPSKSSGGAFGGFTNNLLNASTTYAANGTQPTYDRYTFYRMLDQLATDTLPANQGKVNLNYENVGMTYNTNALGAQVPVFMSAAVIPGMETNLITWTPLDFFSVAADQLLKVYTTNWFQADPTNYLLTYFNDNPKVPIDRFTGFGLTNEPFFGMTNQVPAIGLTNIPVQVNGAFVYSPAVNRLLQLAANIYDASTNNIFPHVFRPIFYRDSVSKNIFIAGYEPVLSANQADTPLLPTYPAPIQAGTLPVQLGALTFTATGYAVKNVYGIPWIIGAKKGFPNFNDFVARNDFQITRKMQVTRKKFESYTSTTAKDFETNQMIVMSITNHVGYSFWNSYAASYVPVNGSGVTVVMNDVANMVLSNGMNNGMSISANWPNPTQYLYQYVTNLTVWPGSAWNVTQSPGTRSAWTGSYVAGTFDFSFLPESVYRYSNNSFIPTWQNPPYETSLDITPTISELPQFSLLTTNGFQAYILDGNNIIDYVQFSGPSSTRNLNAEIQDNNPLVNTAPYQMWITNASGFANNGMNLGVVNQILVSRTGPGVAPANSWVAAPNLPPGTATPLGEADFFGGFFTPTWTYAGTPNKVYVNTNLAVQAPYTPARLAYQYTMWQANDPLVHFLSSDLNEANNLTGYHHSDDPVNYAPPAVTQYLSVVGDRYQPWARAGQLAGLQNVDNNPYNLAYKDPLVYGSDNWDFPTNRYPTVGWLGRVHRGTPWQTVFLKPTNILNMVAALPNPNVGLLTWTNWTGNANVFDAGNAGPMQDGLMFDVFTAAPNDNASRGTLSVNQTHLAAWSAVLSGMIAISNSTPGYPSYFPAPNQTPLVISPAGVDYLDSAVWKIVDGPNGINNMRTNLYPGAGYLRVGDILRVPALTTQSPFINTSDSYHQQYDVSDEEYEWLPQQMLGLVRPTGAPRFVIYAWGQTLKPAADGLVLSGNLFGLVTNYQVVAESATRTVMTVQPVLTNAVVNGVVIPATNYIEKVESFNVLPPQ